eukprot:s1127_g10.t1
MFQLVLSNKLREHLALVAEGAGEQPMVFDSFKPRMFMTPGYSQDAHADNVKVFHGREIRQVPNAAGGMGFVLQLSMAEGDPEGWTAEEIKEYDGWGHDSGRNWRNADRWEKEGFQGVKAKFGERAFGLHHRFYLHFDFMNRMWLSAEDGCEGHPARLFLIQLVMLIACTSSHPDLWDCHWPGADSCEDQVARQLVLGVLDSQLAEACDAAMLPEVQFAYDGDVFRQVWEALGGKA